MDWPSDVFLAAVLEEIDSVSQQLQAGEVVAVLVEAPGAVGRLFVSELSAVGARFVRIAGKVDVASAESPTRLADARMIASIDGLSIIVVRWPLGEDGSGPPRLTLSR